MRADGFKMDSRSCDTVRSAPMLERSGPRYPPFPRIMWHFEQLPDPKKRRRPCSGSPGTEARDAAIVSDRTKAATWAIFSSASGKFGMLVPGSPFLIELRRLVSVNRLA